MCYIGVWLWLESGPGLKALVQKLGSRLGIILVSICQARLVLILAWVEWLKNEKEIPAQAWAWYFRAQLNWLKAFERSSSSFSTVLNNFVSCCSWEERRKCLLFPSLLLLNDIRQGSKAGAGSWPGFLRRGWRTPLPQPRTPASPSHKSLLTNSGELNS